MAITSPLIIFFNLIGLKNAGSIIYSLQVCAAGYFVMELFYKFIHFTVAVPENPEWFARWITNFNLYLFHRSHQYIAIIVILLLLYRNSIERAGTTLRVGNIEYISHFLGPKKPLSWKLIALRLSSMFFGFSALFLFLKCRTGTVSLQETFNNLYMIVPLFLGALNHSFIEELLFRGIFLSYFSRVMNEKYGNFLQALLFGLFHSQFIAIFNSLFLGDTGGFIGALIVQMFILTVYTFLGWIFGRSALETRGIGISTFIHTSIVMSIYLSKGFIY